jgi:hypothetical protein
MDRNIGIFRQLEQVFEPYCTMFVGLKGWGGGGERSSYCHSISAEKENIKTFFFGGVAIC